MQSLHVVAFGLMILTAGIPLSAGDPVWVYHLSNAQEFQRAGELERAQREFESAMRAAREEGDESLAVTHVLGALGVFQGDIGNFARAESCLKRSLAIWRRQMGPEHVALVRVINQLAAVYIETGQLAKAERLDLETWMRRLEAAHAAPQDVVQMLQNLATLDSLRGRAAQSEARFRQALDVAATPGAAPPEERAVTLNNLGLAFLRLGRYQSAIQQLTMSAELWEQLRGPGDRNAGLTRHALGIAWVAAGRLDEAESQFRKALAIAEQSFGPANVRTAAVLKDYSELLRRLHRKSEAKQMSARAVRIRRESVPQLNSAYVVDITELSLRR